MAFAGIIVGFVVFAFALFPLASRRKRGAEHRLGSLGSVSQQWLLSHRHEDL
jgi:hypothetical protein